MDANGWAIVIGALVMGTTTILKMVFDFIDRKAAKKAVEEVKTTLASSVASHDEKLTEVADKVEAVRVNSNGLTEQLIEASYRRGFAEGIASEQRKQLSLLIQPEKQ